ncbi:MAG: deoxyribose-phosphate aldolase [Nitrospirota bacterium]|mgnify:FL=1
MDAKFNIAKLIDHTLLKPEATETDIKKLCKEAEKYSFFSVCVNPCFIKTAREKLSGTGVKISTVIGFPLGAMHNKVKIYEATEAVLTGADELDVVINIGMIKSNNWTAVQKEISDLVTATPDVIHKIIIETYYLSDDEKINASLAVMKSGAEFVKTSTGFAPSGATVKDIEMIKAATKGKIGIKAAGGIRTLKDVLTFIKAGATRIGTSSGITIIKEIR